MKEVTSKKRSEKGVGGGVGGERGGHPANVNPRIGL